MKTEHVELHYVDVQKASQAVSGKVKQYRGTGQTCSSSALTQGDGSLVSEPISWLGHWPESLVLCQQFSSNRIKQVLLDFQVI